TSARCATDSAWRDHAFAAPRDIRAYSLRFRISARGRPIVGGYDCAPTSQRERSGFRSLASCGILRWSTLRCNPGRRRGGGTPALRCRLACDRRGVLMRLASLTQPMHLRQRVRYALANIWGKRIPGPILALSYRRNACGRHLASCVQEALRGATEWS